MNIPVVEENIHATIRIYIQETTMISEIAIEKVYLAQGAKDDCPELVC